MVKITNNEKQKQKTRKLKLKTRNNFSSNMLYQDWSCVVSRL